MLATGVAAPGSLPDREAWCCRMRNRRPRSVTAGRQGVMLPVESLRPEVSTQGAMPGQRRARSAGREVQHHQVVRRDAAGPVTQAGNQHHRPVMLATAVAETASLPDRET